MYIFSQKIYCRVSPFFHVRISIAEAAVTLADKTGNDHYSNYVVAMQYEVASYGHQ
jgi:hypothetical protein